jgi:hypothetical protein
MPDIDMRYRYLTTRHQHAISHDKRDMKCGGDTRGHAQTLHFTMINVIPDSIPYHRGLARSRWQLRRDAWAAATEDRRMPSFHLPVKNDMLVVVVTKSLVPYTKGALYHSFFMGTRHAVSEAARKKKLATLRCSAARTEFGPAESRGQGSRRSSRGIRLVSLAGTSLLLPPDRAYLQRQSTRLLP